MSEKKNIFSSNESEKSQKIPIEWGISHTLIKDISLESLSDDCSKKSTLIYSFRANDIYTIFLPEIVDAISEKCCSCNIPCKKVIEGKMLFIKNLATQKINIKNFLNEEQLILDPSSVAFLTAKNKLTQEWCVRIMGELNTTLQTAYNNSVTGEICLNNIQKDFEILGNNSDLNSLIPSDGILFTVANKDKSEIYLQSGFTHLQGVLGTAIGKNSVALGNQCLSVRPNSFSQGCKNTATGNYIHIEGSLHEPFLDEFSEISNNAHIEGDQCIIFGNLCHIEGYKSQITAGVNKLLYSHVEGSSKFIEPFISHCEGASVCQGEYCHIEGQANSYGNINHAEGASLVEVYPILSFNPARVHSEIMSYDYGITSHTESENFILPETNFVEKIFLHTEGKAATLNNIGHGEGYFSAILGGSSHSEGYNSFAGNRYNLEFFFDGYYAHSEGYQTDAIAWYSHSEGIQTTSGTAIIFSPDFIPSTGSASHSEGYLSKTIGNVSHADGYGTSAIGIVSHSEGYSSTATGFAAHSEGILTTATETASHSEGLFTVASNYASNAAGIGSFSNNVGAYSQCCGNTDTTSVANGDMQYQRLILTGIIDLSGLIIPNITDLQIFGLGSTNPTTQFPKLPEYDGYASYLLSADVIGIGTDGSVGTWFILAVALVSPLGAVTITSDVNQIRSLQKPGILGNIKPNNMAGADAPFFIATGPAREFSVRVSSLDIIPNNQIKWSAVIKITSRFF